MLDNIFDTLQTVCIWCEYYVTIECAQSAQVLVRIIDAQWKCDAVNKRCPDARPWKIPRYIFTRLYTQSQYAQGDQGKYKEYTPPFPLLVKTRAIRFCKWPAQMSDTGNNYIILTGLEGYIRNIDQAQIILPRVERRGQYGLSAVNNSDIPRK